MKTVRDGQMGNVLLRPAKTISGWACGSIARPKTGAKHRSAALHPASAGDEIAQLSEMHAIG